MASTPPKINIDRLEAQYIAATEKSLLCEIHLEKASQALHAHRTDIQNKLEHSALSQSLLTLQHEFKKAEELRKQADAEETRALEVLNSAKETLSKKAFEIWKSKSKGLKNSKVVATENRLDNSVSVVVGAEAGAGANAGF